MAPTVFPTATPKLAILIACSLLAACEDHNWNDGFRGRSDKFVYRDVNGDDRITRPEWERRYGTVVDDPMLVWFDELDCEGDGIVTWREYYHNLFRPLESCAARPAPFPSGSRSENAPARATLGAATLCDTQASFQSAMKSHREELLTRAEVQNVEVECRAPATGKPPYIGYVMGRCAQREDNPPSTDEALFSRVFVRNKNAETTISAVTISIELTSRDLPDANGLKHLKTVSIPPNSEQVVTAWFSDADPELARTIAVNCELHSALGY